MADLNAYLDSLGLGDAEAAPAQSSNQASSGFDVNALADAVAAKLSQGQQPGPEPASNTGAPMATSAGQADPSNVTQWSTEDYERQLQLKAPVPHNRYDIRNRAFYREIRLNAERHMANTRIGLGGRNRK